MTCRQFGSWDSPSQQMINAMADIYPGDGDSVSVPPGTRSELGGRRLTLLMELAPGGLASEMTVNKAISLLEQMDVTDEVTGQRVDRHRAHRRHGSSRSPDEGFEEADPGRRCRLRNDAV